MDYQNSVVNIIPHSYIYLKKIITKKTKFY